MYRLEDHKFLLGKYIAILKQPAKELAREKTKLYVSVPLPAEKQIIVGPVVHIILRRKSKKVVVQNTLSLKWNANIRRLLSSW